MSFMKASDDVKSFVKRLQPIMELGGFLEKVGSLEQAASEVEARHKKACEKIEEVMNTLAMAQSEVLHAQANLEDLDQRGKTIMESAYLKQGEIINQAKIEADKIVAQAFAKKKNVEEGIKELGSLASAIQGEIDDKKAELENISEQYNAIKQKLASFMK